MQVAGNSFVDDVRMIDKEDEVRKDENVHPEPMTLQGWLSPCTILFDNYKTQPLIFIVLEKPNSCMSNKKVLLPVHTIKCKVTFGIRILDHSSAELFISD